MSLADPTPSAPPAWLLCSLPWPHAHSSLAPLPFSAAASLSVPLSTTLVTAMCISLALRRHVNLHRGDHVSLLVTGACTHGAHPFCRFHCLAHAGRTLSGNMWDHVVRLHHAHTLPSRMSGAHTESCSSCLPIGDVCARAAWCRHTRLSVLVRLPSSAAWCAPCLWCGRLAGSRAAG